MCLWIHDWRCSTTIVPSRMYPRVRLVSCLVGCLDIDWGPGVGGWGEGRGTCGRARPTPATGAPSHQSAGFHRVFVQVLAHLQLIKQTYGHMTFFSVFRFNQRKFLLHILRQQVLLSSRVVKTLQKGFEPGVNGSLFYQLSSHHCSTIHIFRFKDGSRRN